MFLTNPEGVRPEDRRDSLDALKDLNEMHLKAAVEPEILTRTASYEMASMTQTSVPDFEGIAKEPKHIHKIHGTEPGKASFVNNRLLAQRLVECGWALCEAQGLFRSGAGKVVERVAQC